MSQKIPILVYHKIDPRFEFSISRITPRRFERHLDWLVSNHYKTMTISEAALRIRNGHQIPEKTVALVFDDGADNVFTYAYPLLRKRKMCATVYMVAGYAGKQDRWDVKIGWRRFQHLSWDQLRELSDQGFEIGSHSVNHPDLTRLNSDQLQYELSESRHILERETAQPIRSFSYPFGVCSDLVKEKVREAGYTSAVLVRNPEGPDVFNGLISFSGACIYQTTRLRRLKHIIHLETPSPFYNLIERSIGWCASRTPIVRGIPDYPEEL